MMRRMLSAVLILVVLLAGAASGEMALDDGVPWVDYSLPENLAQVTERPDSGRDDFYLYANYDWLKSAQIPPGAIMTSAVDETEAETVDQCLRVLNDSSAGGESGDLARQLYHAYLDWDARDALGVAPVQAIVDQIRSVDTLDALTELICGPADLPLFLSLDTQRGMNDPGAYIAWIDPMSLMLTDAAEYRSLTELGEAIQAAFQMIAVRQLPRLGYSEAEAEAILQRAFSLEADLAEHSMTTAERNSPEYLQRINNEMSRAEAAALCGAFPFLRIVDAKGYAGARRFLICEPEYMKSLEGIYREDRLEDLKSFLIIRFVSSTLGSLDRESKAILDDANSIVYGSSGSAPEAEDACSIVREYLPTPMARAFLAKYDASEMKSRIDRLCREAIACYRGLLAEEDWLTGETRARAIEKLDSMTVRAVYPEKWRDYSGLSLAGLGFFDCRAAIGRDDLRFAGSLADQPADPELWYAGRGASSLLNDILNANAYYDQSANAITIMRGILGGSLYADGMSDAALYGGIGYVIAHEISHAFDTVGAQYDAQGRFHNWWQPEDYAAFSERAKKVVAAFNRMTVFGDYSVPGESVQGEAIADMAGLKCMLTMLEQRGSADYRAFFESYAAFFRNLMPPEMVFYLLNADPHPPSYLRCNTAVQQFPQFFEAYGVREGDGMYLSPVDNFMVWFRQKPEAPLKILSQPRDVTVRAGGTAHFRVEATGADAYQWHVYDPDTGKDKPIRYGADINGADDSEGLLTLQNVKPSWDGLKTYCVVSDRAGNTLTSDMATLNVIAQSASGPVDTGDRANLPLYILIAAAALILLHQTRKARR